MFWWNPIVKSLVIESYFLIEARCDELSSVTYGKENYLHDLTSLLLLNKTVENENQLCAMIFNKNINVKRIKNLKGNEKMGIIKKLSYGLAFVSTIGLMSLPVLSASTAMLISSSDIENVADDIVKNEVGALINFEFTHSTRIPADEKTINIIAIETTVWVDFGERALLVIPGTQYFSTKLKVTEYNSEEAYVEVEIIDLRTTPNKLIAEPKLIVSYDKMATVSHGEAEEGNYYKLSFSVAKQVNPSET